MGNQIFMAKFLVAKFEQTPKTPGLIFNWTLFLLKSELIQILFFYPAASFN